MKLVYLALRIALLMGFYLLAQAQEYTASVKHYGPEQGLSHREVNAILQDRQGFMWFGTKFGLNRFDGKTFTTFTKQRNSLDFDDIHSIAEDADGNLWLRGTTGQSQITLFNPLTQKAIAFTKRFGNQQLLKLSNDLQGLLSSDNGTIFLTNYQPATLISYHPKTGLRLVPLPQFKTLGTFRATARNTVWAIADENRIVELTIDGQIVRQFRHGQDVVNWCFGQRNAGIEFFYTVYNPATINQPAFYSVDESGQRKKWPVDLFNSMRRYMSPICYPVDRRGSLWDGISLRDSTNHTLLTIAGQTTGETIENRSFYRDRNGLFWLGTSFGLYQVKLIKNHFRRLIYQDDNKGENGTAIRGIAVLGDELFVNLEKFGLYKMSAKGGVPQKLYTNSVFAYGLVSDGQGKLLAGNGNQLIHYNLAENTYSTLPGPEGTTIWTLSPFRTSQWVAGSSKGLMLVDTRNGRIQPFTQYNQFAELAQGHILHIGADRGGMLWVCATNGLYTLDPQKGITARYWSGGRNGFYLPAEGYQHFYQDPQGIFWLATANEGLIRWDRQPHQFRSFRRKDGLSNDNIYAVYPDRQGKLWLSSDYGIMRLDPGRFTVRAYYVQDGITHNEFNRIAHFQDERGQIYFGGLNGITVFDPQDLETETPPVPPVIRILSLRQFDNVLHQLADKTEQLVTSGKITIQPGDQTAVLDFALLDFTDADKSLYAYQFKGLDSDWTQQTESSLRLSNLPYGTHQLLIRGQAPNGQWSANTISILVEVQRPFYLQVWFLFLMVLLVGGGIWALLRWRIWRHKQEQLRLQNEIHGATARIEADKKLIEKQAEALLQLNEAKSRFFANISHEFRTPLTVILGMAADLKERMLGEQDEDGQRSSVLIERNGRNLLRLINQILDLSKLEAGEMAVLPTQADLVSFTRYVSESFHTMASLKGVHLHFYTNEEVIIADFDKDKLQDVLSNLLTNALKFTPVAGQVFVQLTTCDKWIPLENQGYYEAISPAQHFNKPWISISVRDTGLGIDATRLPLIFDRFFQVITPSISEAGGTGIGLSLVRELIGLMQGGLAVRSRPGEGTEFVIRLQHTQQAPVAQLPVTEPVSTYPDRLSSTRAMPELAGDKPLLLLVEDNEDVASYIISCLQTHYQIIWTVDGHEGINQAFEKIPDLIVSDVMMPLKDGFQVCDELKNCPKTSHIPIVMLTARAAVSDRINGLRQGADAYLTKPFHREELQLVLHNLLLAQRRLRLHYSQLALQPVAPDRGDSLEEQFIMALKVALEPQLTNADLSIDELCQQMGMSRTSLYRKMMALTGMSLTKYVRSLRLIKAKELLTSSDLHIAEVAYSVGFDDPKYFSRVFSEEFGTPPANFRRSAQLKP